MFNLNYIDQTIDYLLKKGMKCEERLDFEGASWYFRKATEIDPGDDFLWKNLACSLSNARDYKGAFRSIEKVEDVKIFDEEFRRVYRVIDNARLTQMFFTWSWPFAVIGLLVQCLLFAVGAAPVEGFFITLFFLIIIVYTYVVNSLSAFEEANDLMLMWRQERFTEYDFAPGFTSYFWKSRKRRYALLAALFFSLLVCFFFMYRYKTKEFISIFLGAFKV